MLLGARIYLQATTNLNAQLWDEKIVFQTTKNKFFLKKGEKIWRKSWRKIMIEDIIILIRRGMEFLTKYPFSTKFLFFFFFMGHLSLTEAFWADYQYSGLINYT
jgi:hypothetical protein